MVFSDPLMVRCIGVTAIDCRKVLKLLNKGLVPIMNSKNQSIDSPCVHNLFGAFAFQGSIIVFFGSYFCPYNNYNNRGYASQNGRSFYTDIDNRDNIVRQSIPLQQPNLKQYFWVMILNWNPLEIQ